MPGAGSEHPMAAKICRVGEGASQEGVFGVFGVGDGVPSSPWDTLGCLEQRDIPAFYKQELAVPGCPSGMAAWGSQSCTGSRGAFPSSEVLGVMMMRV